MALRFNVVSADDHVQEPPDLWTSRVSRERWGDRIPHVTTLPDGVERWTIDGRLKEDRRFAATGALADERFREPQNWSDVPAAAYDPEARLAAMDRDGVDVQILYPSVSGIGGEVLGTIQDPELEVACVRAYNDWVLETWGAAGPRFVPQCIAPISSVEAAKAEVERAVKAGHRGVVMPPFPWHIRPELPHLHDEAWDPLWATIQDAGVPICWHSGTSPRNMLELDADWNDATSRAFESARRPVSSAMVVSSFLLSRIGERFPKLKVVFAAAGINWLSFQLELSDHEWQSSMLQKEGMTVKPSDLFHRQCFVTTWFEKAGFTLRDFIGVDNIMWQSEFPMETSTWPTSSDFIARNLGDLPEGERRKILVENAAGLYGIPT